ncbi:FAAH [Lepeophtheirus salmonis]|uniref:FAAH n=1 Tax=Lepeophtheirus salmonis TaxID=72036 RepID=A0A7R8H5M3_LEPSM|nr:FAAH [Lepeophtheirus salmonis]CAF2866256.1 FAAH [Lepeophtheirus salmonis]
MFDYIVGDEYSIFSGSLFVTTIISIGAIFISYKIARMLYMRDFYKSKIMRAKNRKQEMKDKIRREISLADGTLITSHRQDILKLKLEELVEKLQSSLLSPLQVLQAYQAKAILVDDETNCIVEFIDDAEIIAKELNKVSDKKILSSIWSSVERQRMFSIEAMRTMGVIPFCRTNNPQMLKSFGCSNPIYGNTTNPFNNKLTAGGSSGGEAALIAGGGSIIGIGSDIGGSLRVPAHFCGIASLKPTFGRLLENGFRLKRDQQPPFFKCCSGFMSKDVSALIKLHALFADQSEEFAKKHYSLVPLKWNRSLLTKRKMKIGWFDHNNYFEAVPSCTRALYECVDLLSQNGHDLIKIEDPGTPKLVDIVLSSFQSDGGARVRSVVDEKECIDECYRLNYYLAYVPEFIKYYLGKIIFTYIIPSKILLQLSSKKALPASEIWRLSGELQTFEEKVHEIWWQSLGLDAVITPGFAFPAIPNSEVSIYLPAAAFTAPYNILDLPAGVVPFTKVNQEDINKMDGYPYHESDDYLFKRLKTKLTGTIDCPVGVQVIGKKWQEETVLYLMNEIQHLLKFKNLVLLLN